MYKDVNIIIHLNANRLLVHAVHIYGSAYNSQILFSIHDSWKCQFCQLVSHLLIRIKMFKLMNTTLQFLKCFSSILSTVFFFFYYYGLLKLFLKNNRQYWNKLFRSLHFSSHLMSVRQKKVNDKRETVHFYFSWNVFCSILNIYFVFLSKSVFSLHLHKIFFK